MRKYKVYYLDKTTEVIELDTDDLDIAFEQIEKMRSGFTGVRQLKKR